MIEKVYVLNLPHRHDRRHFMRGHLETIGVPEHCVEFFDAKYGKDYESLDTIIDDAMADGFPDFSKWRGSPHYTPAMFSYIWNWCRMMRAIETSEKTTLILLDDKMLLIEWERLNSCVGELVKNHNFQCLQVGWGQFGKRDYMYLPGELINGLIRRGTRSFGDYATVLTSQGASFLFDLTYPEAHVAEWVFWSLSRANSPQPKGFFHFDTSQVADTPINWGQNLYVD